MQVQHTRGVPDVPGLADGPEELGDPLGDPGSGSSGAGGAGVWHGPQLGHDVRLHHHRPLLPWRAHDHHLGQDNRHCCHRR